MTSYSSSLAIPTVVDERFVILSNDVPLPLLGLGTTHSGGYDHQAVLYALKECGYRMIDTAKRYGVETELGRAIKESGVPRNELFLTTKLWPVDYGYLNSQEECKQSCRRLGVNYLDLYILHFPEAPSWFDKPQSVVLEETWRAMEKLYENELCRSIGVSNFNESDLDRLLDYCSVRPHVNQYEFHPYYNPKSLRQFCKEENITFTGYCPLAKGTILNEEPILRISQKYKRSPAQICIRWSIQQNVPAIPKSLKLHRLLENSHVFDFDIHENDMQILNALHDPRRKQVALDNLQEKFALPSGYKLNIPVKSSMCNGAAVTSVSSSKSSPNSSGLLLAGASPNFNNRLAGVMG